MNRYSVMICVWKLCGRHSRNFLVHVGVARNGDDVDSRPETGDDVGLKVLPQVKASRMPPTLATNDFENFSSDRTDPSLNYPGL